MVLTENSIVTEITTLPLENIIQVKWRNTIEKDGEVISSKDHYRLFGPGQQAEFEAEVEGAAAYVGLVNWGLENETQVTE